MASGTLYIVSTPIGNLEDMTFRAVRVLKEADLIAAEDTRRSSKLFDHYGINNRVTSFHSHNIRARIPALIAELEKGKDVALVSDSGTPGISDPGSVLVKECVDKGMDVKAVPGPTAAIAALVVSGKPTHKFLFEGFLSNKKGKRRRQIEALKEEERTVIVYESPHRIIKFLEDFRDICGERELAVARELTKKFEEVVRGTATELTEHFGRKQPRGEFIVVF
ncbi:MAG: 16S rRNA (cytidine(1402)-2'-O)-methyltransferase [Candidatus Omnitrophica bacterium]|nr:16S rRNA (cytidine(1402)-2'-O)-methyltransferase [Candidatus Omnitrophota bacterium]